MPHFIEEVGRFLCICIIICTFATFFLKKKDENEDKRHNTGRADDDGHHSGNGAGEKRDGD